MAVSLHTRNYETFLPLHWRFKRNSRKVGVEAPLFPGYVFCRWTELNPQRIVEVPGVVRLVSVGRIPQSIPESEIEAVQRVVGSGLLSKPWEFLEKGQSVRLVAGPLQGLEGILVTGGNKSYIVVNITIMQRAVAVQVTPNHVVPSGESVALLASRRFRELTDEDGGGVHQ